jgi:hypothetical protein
MRLRDSGRGWPRSRGSPTARSTHAVVGREQDVMPLSGARTMPASFPESPNERPFCPSVSQHCGVHRARRRAGNRRDAKPRLLEKAIEHAPGECSVKAAACDRDFSKAPDPREHRACVLMFSEVLQRLLPSTIRTATRRSLPLAGQVVSIALQELCRRTQV